MDTPEGDTLDTSGVLAAAWGILDATRQAPERSLETLDTPFGRADVILDEHGADVHLDGEGATVHVRLDGDQDCAGLSFGNCNNAT